MTANFELKNFIDLRPNDQMGFAHPDTPAYSIVLLINYMRTNLVQHVLALLHSNSNKFHSISLQQNLVESLEQVIDTWDGTNRFEWFTRNHSHIDPDYQFKPEQDFFHDLCLMKHHLNSNRKRLHDCAPEPDRKQQPYS